MLNRSHRPVLVSGRACLESRYTGAVGLRVWCSHRLVFVVSLQYSRYLANRVVQQLTLCKIKDMSFRNRGIS